MNSKKIRPIELGRVSDCCICSFSHSSNIPNQEHHINLLHIESRKSRRRNSELEVLVDCDSERETLNKIIQLLRKQANIITMDLQDRQSTPEDGISLFFLHKN